MLASFTHGIKMCLWCPKGEVIAIKSSSLPLNPTTLLLDSTTQQQHILIFSFSCKHFWVVVALPGHSSQTKSRADTFFLFQAPSSAISHAGFFFSFYGGHYQVEDVVSSCRYILLPVPSFYRHLLYLFSSTEFFYADWRLTVVFHMVTMHP